ncbi:MAG: T9SS type A sorting domain-containing protein, partial [Bacteroidetes bacterium]|nr:T9SS type A sorting domain-containing protein [Bacteroidota bacterium]
GTSWTALNAAQQFATTSYDWWFGGIRLDPNNPSQLYMLLIDTYRSPDGGLNWYQIVPNAHVDHHALAFAAQPGLMVLGNDGGINLTDDYFQLYSGVDSQNLPIAQIYALDVAPWDSSYLLAGAQDNGIYRKYPGSGNQWMPEYGGDGVNCRINYLDPPEGLFLSAQYGWFYFISSQFGGFFPSGFNMDERFNWRSPIVKSLSVTNNVYVAGNRVYKSVDAGQNFSPISQDLTGGPGAPSVVFGTITALEVAPSDENVIYAGTDDAHVWKTNNGGLSWTEVDAGLPHRWVTSIKVDPQHPEKVWITFSGYRYAENIVHVYASENGGSSWTDISGDMPDIPVNDIIIDSLLQNYFFLATDIGVFYTANAGQHWQLLGTDMPSVPVNELRMYYPTHTLFAATYGRGAYKFELGGFTGIPDQAVNFNVSAFPNPCREQVTITVSSGKTGEISLQVLDAQLNLVYEEKNRIHAGVNPIPFHFGQQYPRGIYFIVIRTGGYQRVLKIILN